MILFIFLPCSNPAFDCTVLVVVMFKVIFLDLRYSYKLVIRGLFTKFSLQWIKGYLQNSNSLGGGGCLFDGHLVIFRYFFSYHPTSLFIYFLVHFLARRHRKIKELMVNYTLRSYYFIDKTKPSREYSLHTDVQGSLSHVLYGGLLATDLYASKNFISYLYSVFIY